MFNPQIRFGGFPSFFGVYFESFDLRKNDVEVDHEVNPQFVFVKQLSIRMILLCSNSIKLQLLSLVRCTLNYFKVKHFALQR